MAKIKPASCFTVLKAARTRVSSPQHDWLNETCCGDETRVLATFNTVINNSRVLILIITHSVHCPIVPFMNKRYCYLQRLTCCSVCVLSKTISQCAYKCMYKQIFILSIVVNFGYLYFQRQFIFFSCKHRKSNRVLLY